MFPHNPDNTVQQKVATQALKLFVLLFVVCASVIIVFKRTDWFPWIGDCYPNASADHFLAYCHSVRYGDYEHYAYFHEIEEEAVKQVKKADVLFLGNSNTQFGFSTAAVAQYFQATHSQHYVLGFGHGAQSGVAQQVMQRLQLSPNTVVINADPFFTGEVNATFQRLVSDAEDGSFFWHYLPDWLHPTIHGEHHRKRWLQVQQRNRCEGAASDALWCDGRVDTLYRNKLNGHWVVDNYRENLQLPVSEDDILHLDTLIDSAKVAESFIQSLGLNKSCVFLTVTPRTSTPTRYVRLLAQELNLPVLIPNLENLTTIDGSHLDAISAERWSQAFLQLLTPHLQECITNTSSLQN